MFEKLKAFVGDNAEALELIKSLEETSTSNVDRINTLERQVSDVTETRDKFKIANTHIKDVLGLDVVNEELIDEALAKLKGGKGDEASLAEIANLKDLLTKSEGEKNQLTQSYEGKISTMALDNEIANSGIGANVLNEAMFGIVTGLIKQGASYNDGKIVYKNEDGSTVYGADKQPLTLSGKMESLKSDPSYAGLFKPVSNPGGGAPTGNPVPGGNNTQSLKPTEKMKAGRPS
jgi:hypothetical protein